MVEKQDKPYEVFRDSGFHGVCWLLQEFVNGAGSFSIVFRGILSRALPLFATLVS